MCLKHTNYNKKNLKELFSPNTFGISLLIAEAWLKTYTTLMVKELGFGFYEIIAYKDWRGINWLKSVEEQKRFENHLKRKFVKNKDFFLTGLKRYFKLINEFNNFTRLEKSIRCSRSVAWQRVKNTLLYVQKLFPYYVLIYYICNRPYLRNFFNEVIAEIETARLEVEGYYDRADRYLKHLMKDKISQKYFKYYPVLKERELNSLLFGQSINVNHLKIRQAEGYVITIKEFIEGPINLKEYLRKNHYYYPNLELKLTNELKGRVIIKGKAYGRVRLIFSKRGLKSLKAGEIIVTPMTSPDFVPYIKKAAAVITDFGGILSHAAIACRELKKVCLVDTKRATLLFQNGDLAVVDANKGIIRKL